jgi:hypothetical protein
MIRALRGAAAPTNNQFLLLLVPQSPCRVRENKNGSTRYERHTTPIMEKEHDKTIILIFRLEGFGLLCTGHHAASLSPD